MDPNSEFVLEKTEPLGDKFSSELIGVSEGLGGSGALGFGFSFSGETVLFSGESVPTNLTFFFFVLGFVFFDFSGGGWR